MEKISEAKAAYEAKNKKLTMTSKRMYQQLLKLKLGKCTTITETILKNAENKKEYRKM